MIVLVVLLLAHSWYDLDCCSDRDCRPVPVDQVRVVSGGYMVRKDSGSEQFIKYESARRSRDQDYHKCELGDHVRCLYVPGGVS